MAALVEKVPDDYVDGSRYCSFEEMQTLSHDPKGRDDFTLMILVGMLSTPAFWKPGDLS
jgi:hypothetical protein